MERFATSLVIHQLYLVTTILLPSYSFIWKASATLSKQQFLHIQVYPPYRSSISSSATVTISTSIQNRSWSIFAGLKFFSIYCQLNLYTPNLLFVYHH